MPDDEKPGKTGEDPRWVERGIKRVLDLEGVILTYRANIASLKERYQREVDAILENRGKTGWPQSRVEAEVKTLGEELIRRAAEEASMLNQAVDDLNQKKDVDYYLLPSN